MSGPMRSNRGLLALTRAACVAAVLAGAGAAVAQNSVGWRTDGTGRYPDSTPPEKWSMAGGKGDNLVWATKLPAWSNATPVVWKDRVFVCAEPDTLICVSLSDGKIRWQAENDLLASLGPDEKAKAEEARKKNAELEKQIQANEPKIRGAMQARRNDPNDQAAKKLFDDTVAANNALRAQMVPVPGGGSRPPTHGTNGWSSPTPVTDGKIVVAHFGTGSVGVYDLDGKRIWLREVERPDAGWGQSSSPLLIDGKVIVMVKSLFALDPATGKELWRCNTTQRWGSPVATKIGDAWVVITPSGQIVRASDGKQLCTGLGMLEYNAPVVVDGVVYFTQGNATAWKLPDKIEGDSIKPEKLWTANLPPDRYYASPVIHDGRMYATNKNGAFTITDIKTGKVTDQKDLGFGQTTYPSIVYAGGRVLVSTDTGTTVVLKPGDKYEEVARNKVEGFRTTPVFAGNLMLIRGFDHLMCFQGGKPVASAR